MICFSAENPVPIKEIKNKLHGTFQIQMKCPCILESNITKAMLGFPIAIKNRMILPSFLKYISFISFINAALALYTVTLMVLPWHQV